MPIRRQSVRILQKETHPMRQFLISAVALAALAVFASPACRADKVDDFIKDHMAKEHIPGLSLAVVKDGKVARAQGYGFANLELKVPASPETVYILHSVSKQFVATAAMQLVEQGKLGLQDPVSKYFPDAPEMWKDVKVWHLLSHTSGIKDYLNDVNLDLPDGSTQMDILHAVMKLPMNFQPGEKWSYNNTGFLMLAQIIHQITGQTTQEYLKEHVWGPLGMTSARASSKTDIIPDRASYYLWRKDHWENGEFPYTTEQIGAGGMMSNVLDLAKWDASLYTSKILSDASRSQMFTPVTLNDGSKAPYGYGFFVKDFSGHRMIWHYGATAFLRTNISRFIDDKLTIIVLTSGGAPKINDIAQGVAAIVNPTLGAAIAKG
jgi:CubicO group peptidase (beta-lactamase class C family)